MFAFFKSSKEPMVEQICSLEVAEGITGKKVERSVAFVAPVFFKESNDEKKMKKHVVTDVEK